jgi:DNA-binding NtrC family response regulator
LIEEAAGGTLFLDEVGDLSLDSQSKLLRFLEEGEYYRIGGTRKLQTRTRVVSATNKNLEGMIGEGTFRHDLYFRLAVIKMEVPPLNERREDILPLANHFLLEFSRKFGKRITGISHPAAKALENHGWQGHIRELKNLIERGVLVGQGPKLTAEDLGLTDKGDTVDPDYPAPTRSVLPPEGIDLPAVLADLEMQYFEQALKISGGNESKAARLLNLNHHTFRYRKKKLQKR